MKNLINNDESRILASPASLYEKVLKTDNLIRDKLLKNKNFVIIPYRRISNNHSAHYNKIAPCYPAWQNIKETPRHIYNDKTRLYDTINWSDYYGIVLQPHQFVLDVDYRNGGLDSLKRFEVEFDYDFHEARYCVQTNSTPATGYHFYFELPQSLIGEKFKQHSKAFSGLEFISFPHCMRAPGSLRINGNRYGYRDGTLPLHAAVNLPMLPFQIETFILDHLIKDTQQSIREEKTLYKASDLKTILSRLPVEEFRVYTLWRDLLFSAHYFTGGARDALDVFIDWSTNDKMYAGAADEITFAWDRIKNDRSDLVTSKTLFHHYQKFGGNPNEITSQVQFNHVKVVDEEKHRYIETLSEWMYVSDAGFFYNKEAHIKDTPINFNLRFKHHSKCMSNESLEQNMIDRVHSFCYKPKLKEKYFYKGKRRYYNTYQSPDIIAVPGDVTKIIHHFNYLYPNDGDVHIIFSFIAHLVQNPGDKIMWCILMQSDVQGVGKSEPIRRILDACIGSHNFSMPTNESLHRDYNNYLENKQAIMVEEIYTKSSYIVNKLKPWITQEEILLCEKYIPAYFFALPQAFFLFTNFRSPLPLEKNDRRFCIFMTSVQPRRLEYYFDLYEFIEKNKAQIYHFFLTYRYDKRIMKGRAPKTKGTETMKRLSQDDLTDEINAMYENKEFPFGFKLLLIKDLTKKISTNWTFRRVGAILSEIGYADCRRVIYPTRDGSDKRVKAYTTLDLKKGNDTRIEIEKYEAAFAQHYREELKFGSDRGIT